MKDDRREGAPNVQLWSREGFGGPLSVLVRPTNGTAQFVPCNVAPALQVCF
jgi:hypothetical protein